MAKVETAIPFQPLNTYGDSIRLLGTGTYGQVTLTTCHYAVKTMSTNEGFTTASTIREIAALKMITSPYVVPLVDVNLTSEVTNLVMPVADETLFNVMDNPNLDIPSLIRQLGLGLATLHNSNLLHLDLKPSNLLLTRLGPNLLRPEDFNYSKAQLWIADFSICRFHTAVLPSLEETFFTLWYRSPELLLKGPATSYSDVWAFGVILVDLLLSKYHRRKVLFFEAADSAKEQLQNIFKIFGTPTDGSLINLAGWKNSFPKYPNIAKRYFQFAGFSPEEIDVVTSILVLDFMKRPSIFEILCHPWFGLTRFEIPIKLLPREILRAKSRSNEYKWPDQHQRQITISWMGLIVKRLNLSDQSYALGVYLLDSWVARTDNPMNRNYYAYVTASLLIASNFYETYNENPEDYVNATKGAFTLKQLEICTNTILTESQFNLAVVTSYFFIRYHQNPLASLTKKIWRCSLLTKSHFQDPEEVANAILELSSGQQKSKQAITLYQEILALPRFLDTNHVQELLQVKFGCIQT